jgi:hypothetical protein
MLIGHFGGLYAVGSLGEKGSEGVDGIHLVQDRVRWWAAANMTIKMASFIVGGHSCTYTSNCTKFSISDTSVFSSGHGYIFYVYNF